MCRSKQLGGLTCPSPFECPQQHLEVQIVESKDGAGEAVEFFCINNLTPQQIALLQQFIDSVSPLSTLCLAAPLVFADGLPWDGSREAGVPRGDRQRNLVVLGEA